MPTAAMELLAPADRLVVLLVKVPLVGSFGRYARGLAAIIPLVLCGITPCGVTRGPEVTGRSITAGLRIVGASGPTRGASQ
jgi:hypothetical protein